MNRPTVHRIARTLAALGLALGLTGCASLIGEKQVGPGPDPSSPGAAPSAAPASASAGPAALPYDVRPLLKPAHKYLGVSADGAPTSMDSITAFAQQVGKQPNLIESYSGWGDNFDAKGAKNAWDAGAVSYIAWEPFTVSLADIAAGKSDDYIRGYAAAIRNLDVPVALSFAHEMNGGWYAWGTKHATPDQFVAAYRHVHDVFAQLGAGNVIWVWSPNSINPMPNVQLQPYYPGDTYVDWVGIVAYYTHLEAGTFQQLYIPTLTEVRQFTDKPFLISETASEPGARKPADIANLAAGVIAHPDCLGFIWFDYNKEVDWKVDSDPQALAAFKRAVSDGRYGFDVRNP
ncbi:beta-mannanase [Kitasatospora sp. RB6PN24]|uniref:glycoside hydrolase family 26 protein n=1 Tax=Kitasatospora humi TaxID=2893891 RepID=UPI001E600364|nr:glycosyl hydrolase [Kitasatospora humi]MCC9309635.1 beta-mannanase [Kitasatospora humi]